MEEKNRVYYLGHSAWAVETQRHYLLFDCQNSNIKPGGKLMEGWVDLQGLSDKPVLVFYSHRHHDHYSRKLHQESAAYENITTILGDFEKPDIPNTITLRPREMRELGDITVYTAASTDEGVCFFVRTEEAGIFFAGDHAAWDESDRTLYQSEIDYIAALGLKTDIAFIPVCTFSGERPAAMTQGAFYAITRLNPEATYPMHANGRESLYKDFEKDLREAGLEAKIICAKGR